MLIVTGELTCKNIIKIKYGFDDFNIKSIYRSHVSLKRPFICIIKKPYGMYKINVVSD